MTFDFKENNRLVLKRFLPILVIVMSLLGVFEVFYSNILKYQKEFSVATINSIFQDYSKSLNPYLLSQGIETLEKSGPIKCTKIFNDSGKMFLDLSFKSWCHSNLDSNNFFRSKLKSINGNEMVVEFKLQVPWWFNYLIYFIRILVAFILIFYGRWIFKHTKRELLIKKRESDLLNEKIKMGKQIAHDIRSPLVALEMALSSSNLAVDNILFRNAIRRIHNMADGLLYEKSFNANYPTCLADLIKSSVYEKEFSASKNGVKIKFEYLSNYLSFYADVERFGFLRMLSNILNNSIEALQSPELKSRIIDISLKKFDTNIEIFIKDNGNGIPQDVLKNILKSGGTYNKKNGLGIGLTQTKEYVQKMNGKFDIKSNLGSGTEIIITFPALVAPSCLVQKLQIYNGHKIVLIDDDPSLGALLSQKFNNENILYFRNFNEIKDIKVLENADFVFVDLDTSIKSNWDNGIDFIKCHKIEQKSILFTGNSEDPTVLKSCIQNNIKLLPKSHFTYIETVDNKKNESKIKIVIDDDQLFKLSINATRRDTVCFNSIQDFLSSQFNDINKVEKILVDSELGTLRGEQESKRLYDQGYRNIFLYTGHARENFDLASMPWIKDVISKSESIFSIL